MGLLTDLLGDGSGVSVRASDPAIILARQAGASVDVGDTAAWQAHTAGTGTITTGTDADVGDYIRMTTTAQANYRIGRDFPLRMHDGRFLTFKVRRNDANLSQYEMWVGVDEFSIAEGPQWNKSVSNLTTGEWHTVVVTMAEAESRNGTIADPFDMRALSIRITPTAATDTSLDIADLRIVQGYEAPGSVSFLFDDGRDDTYTEAFPRLGAKGWAGGVAVEHGTVGTAGRCTLTQLSEMYDAGWDMSGHHTADMTALAAADQVTVHRASKAFLNTNGFERGSHIWVWPGGTRNTSSETIARRYWQVMRRTSSFQVYGEPHAVDPVDPAILYITSSTTLASVQAKVDTVATYGGHIMFVFHSLKSSGLAAEDWLISDFQSLLDYIETQGVGVVPPSDAWTERTA